MVNTLLSTEITALTTNGIFALPAVTVNTKLVYGKITSQEVFSAICNGFMDGTQPDVCLRCDGCGSGGLENCAVNGVCGKEGGKGEGWGGGGGGGVGALPLIMSLLFTVAAFSGAGFVYYRRQQTEMRNEVRGILAQYMPLEDQDLGLDMNNMGGTVI